jgi:hypothetical protein
MDAVEAPAKAEIPPELTARWAIANAMTLKRDSFGTRQRGEASVGRGRNHVKDRTDGLLEASRRRLAGSASIPIMAEAAEDQYFNALAEEEWASSERKLRFMVHFADILTTLEMDVLCVVGDECRDRGHCALSIDAIAEEALVSNARVYSALRAARRLGLIEIQENVIRIISPEWQALLISEESPSERDDVGT